MILEVVILNIVPGQEKEFESASPMIASMNGYRWHQLQHCVEVKNRYLLLVQWQTLEDQTVGFRGSAEYQEWRALLHRFYDPFPTVEHYELVQDYSKETNG